MLRRSRGYAPEPIRLQRPLSRPVLAVGGHLKNTFCLGKGHHAFVSHHIGDLDNLETLRSFGEGIAHYTALFDIQPEVIAHDLHPDYLSSKWALDSSLAAVEHGSIAIQHHHAHIGSVLAEHGLDGPVIGIAADGAGYGPDGAIWGGEIMAADLTGFERMAHLAYMPMPGGAQAIRQPWRMAAVYLQRAFGDDFLNLNIPFTRSLNRQRWLLLAQMIERDLNCPPTSSLGRLFDAVASLLIGRMEALYEGQAAIELEMMATPTADSYPFAIEGDAPLQLDVRPTIRAIVQDIQRGVEAAVIAGRFHSTVSTMLTVVCRRVRAQTGLADVALSGGVFQNRLLLEQLLPQLAAAGFQTYRNHQVPPNDGGLSLGQAAIAAAQFD
jgi:hydrogenase maturation protein HypF